MKVAIVLTGQARFCDASCKDVKTAIANTPDIEFDIYAHAWSEVPAYSMTDHMKDNIARYSLHDNFYYCDPVSLQSYLASLWQIPQTHVSVSSISYMDKFRAGFEIASFGDFSKNEDWHLNRYYYTFGQKLSLGAAIQNLQHQEYDLVLRLRHDSGIMSTDMNSLFAIDKGLTGATPFYWENNSAGPMLFSDIQIINDRIGLGDTIIMSKPSVACCYANGIDNAVNQLLSNGNELFEMQQRSSHHLSYRHELWTRLINKMNISPTSFKLLAIAHNTLVSDFYRCYKGKVVLQYDVPPGTERNGIGGIHDPAPNSLIDPHYRPVWR